jgi:hypothetical protein
MKTIRTSVASCIAAVLLIAMSGCHSSSKPATAIAANQPFPIVALVYPHAIQNVDLIADYGYIIDWASDSKPTFYVFKKPGRTRLRTSSWETFIAELRTVPDGSEIDSVSKCMVPFAWKMPDDKRAELDRVLREKSIKTVSFEDQARHTSFCYCESKAVVVLSDEVR